MKDYNDMSPEEKIAVLSTIIRSLARDCAELEKQVVVSKNFEVEYSVKLMDANKLAEAYKCELQRINYIIQSFMQIHPWHGLDENDVYVKGTDADKLRAIHDILKNGKDIGIAVW